ncbi:MAG: zinc-binding alcohol dehydrogenase [Chloroflexota bacterium]|nr:zinc-binding alcohol dehydrogenase [Chloroflexota bacterium]
MSVTTAQVLTVVEPRRLAWVERILPPPGPDEVVVETLAGAVSVGSELPVVRGRARSATPAVYPTTTGYESIGIVRARGAAVRNLAPGDRVVATYGHATAAIVPAAKALPVPPTIPNTVALLAILTCDVAKGLRKLHPQPGEALLVTGAGAIGLLAIWTARQQGVGPIDTVEPRPERRALAVAMEARRVVAPVDEDALEPHYLLGVECSSADDAFRLLQTRMASGGRICVLSDGNDRPLTLAPEFHAREIAVVGSSDGEDYPSHARWLFAQPQPALDRLAAVFDLRVPVAHLLDTFERLGAGAVSPVKVFVDYAPESMPC